MPEKDKKICPNCAESYDVNYKFCPYCGQENRDINLKFKFVVSEFLSSAFNVDNKMWVTLKYLLFKPAFLTREFIDGKRTKYITPVRLYLFVSLIYFFVLSFSSDSGIINVGVDSSNAPDTTGSEKIIGISIDDEKKDLSDFQKIIVEKAKYLKTENGKKIFYDKFRKNISTGMFLLIPLTALILMMLFGKNGYYIEHLILMLHLQSFWFILFLFNNFLKLLTGKNLFVIVTFFLMIITVIWLKNFYRVKISTAILKTLLFFLIFFMLLILFLIVTLLFSMLFL